MSRPHLAGTPSRHGVREPHFHSPSRADRKTASALGDGMQRSWQHLLSLQRADGHWVGELQGDTILESEWILLMAFLGREGEERPRKAARYILEHQLDHGGWSSYPDGPLEVSVSVKAYFALKLTGHDPEAPSMRRAREAILAHGGAARCNSFTKFYLALLGQLPYECCPSVPPEIMLLPRWSYVNLYAMSSWTRTIVVPLSIFSACKPTRRLPTDRGIAELFVTPPSRADWPAPLPRRLFSWTGFFLGVDWLYKRAEGLGLLAPFRRTALRRAEAWMRERFEDSDGLGAIFPPMIYTVISLRCLGVADDAPEMQWALRQLDDLMIEEADTLRLQPCVSPVWDTALAVNALGAAGLTGASGAVRDGVRWLLEREVRRRGDWSHICPDLEPGGWFFEYRNAFYPDVDDTAMVLLALARTGTSGSAEAAPAVQRGLRWLLGMQNSDGGWAAFDRDINREVLTRVPFADHNAMLDPSCPDITARVLEVMGWYGYPPDNEQVQKGVAFIRAAQEPTGAWLGRWGVNYLYGTWQVLQGLEAVGFDMSDPMIGRAVRWLERVQQPCGGWGESCRTYDDPSLAGQGEPTPSQTAWAVLALQAAGAGGGAAAQKGVRYLLDTQKPDGGWEERQFTGTGFPRVFYLKYHYYCLYFPLMALARAVEIGRQDGTPRQLQAVDATGKLSLCG